MAGHSKWSSIKHKKAIKDARRGKLFSKLIKEITVAARLGGGDPAANPRLRTAIAAAKSNSMPAENIERAIKKGTGEIEGASYEEIQYEGYGPGGVAILVSAMTDNRNRTVAELRKIFSRHGGNLGETGCVAWMFDRRGVVTVESGAADEERLMELALEAGAQDVVESDGIFEIITEPEELERVRESIEGAGIAVASAEVRMVPKDTVRLTGAEAEKALRLLEELDDHDDVQNVASNFDISQEDLERLTAA